MDEVLQKIKDNTACIGIGLAICLLCFATGYLLGIRNLHGDGAGINDIRGQLDQAGRDQSAITDGLDDAQKSAGEVTAGITASRGEITAAGETADRIEAGEQEAGELIAECQSILADVRRRGKSDTSED